VQVGKGVKYFPNAGVAEFLVESQSITTGDEMLITGPTTGVIEFTLTELRINGKSAQTAKRGDRISFPLKEKIRASDKLFKWEENKA
jgi:putative protease